MLLRRAWAEVTNWSQLPCDWLFPETPGKSTAGTWVNVQTLEACGTACRAVERPGSSSQWLSSQHTLRSASLLRLPHVAFPLPVLQMTERRLREVCHFIPSYSRCLQSAPSSPPSPPPLRAGHPCSPLTSITRLTSSPALNTVVPVGRGVLLRHQPSRTLTAGADKLFVASKVTRHRDECCTRSCLHRADQGRLLDCVVRWGNLTEGKIRAYLGEVLEAVRYLHNCRIAHLDLKVSGAPGAKASMSDHGPATWLSGASSQPPSVSTAPGQEAWGDGGQTGGGG